MKKVFIGLLTAICIVCFAFFTVSCAEDGQNGKDGLNGKDGVSISKTEINADGELILTMTDGTVVNVGKVEGTDGKDGEQGPQGDKGEAGNGIVKAEINTNGELILTMTDGTVINLGKIGGGELIDQSHKITFDANGGSGQSEVVKLKNGQAVELPKNSFTKQGHDFMGWATEKNGDVVYVDNAQIIGTDQDVTLYAVWATTSIAFIVDNDAITQLTEYGKSLTEIIIPSQMYGVKIKSIKNNAFHGGDNLISVTIPNCVTSIDSGVFYGCNSLESINVSSGNNVYRSENNCIIKNSTHTLIACCKSAVIPNSVATIGYHAFNGCSSLTSIAIPDSVTSIEWGAFEGCNSLETITVSSGNSIYRSENNCIIEKSTDTLVAGCKNSVIPSSVTSIGDSAFYNCSGLTSITILDSVTSIGNGAFMNCSSLTSITILDSVASIGNGAFMNCSSLTSITIPDSVTSIGDDTFSGCSSLTSVIIGKSITSIGDFMFSGCSSLTNVTIGNSVKSIGDYAFYNCGSLKKVYCGGTKEQWNKIYIGGENSELLNATRYYYSEKQPTTSGNYWHYVDGKIKEW